MGLCGIRIPQLFLYKLLHFFQVLSSTRPGREKPQAIFPESRNSGIPCIIPLDSGNRTPVLL